MSQVINEEVAQDIVNLMKDKKHEVKKGAMMILMQSVQQKENQQFFKDKEICKILLREFTETDVEKCCLSNLIILSQNEYFRKEIFSIKGVFRLIERVIDLVKIMIKKDQIYQENEGFRKMVSEQVQFILLLLSNLLIDEEGADQLLQIEQKDIQGVLLIHLLNYYQSELPDILAAFLYFSNILTNLTSFPQIRQKIIESQVNIIDRLLPTLLNEQVTHKRLQNLKTLRNLTFEYENPFILQSIICQNNQYVNILFCYLLILNNTFRFVDLDDHVYLIVDNKKFTNQSPYFQEVALIIDILTTLVNVDMIEQKSKFDKKIMIQLMLKIKQNSQIHQETKDKIDVILAIYCQYNQF